MRDLRATEADGPATARARSLNSAALAKSKRAASVTAAALAPFYVYLELPKGTGHLDGAPAERDPKRGRKNDLGY